MQIAGIIIAVDNAISSLELGHTCNASEGILKGLDENDTYAPNQNNQSVTARQY